MRFPSDDTAAAGPRPEDAAVETFASAILGAGSTPPHAANDDPRADVCTVAEVARWLGVDRKTIYDAVKRRELPCGRLGRRVILSRAAITAWLGGRLPGAASR